MDTGVLTRVTRVSLGYNIGGESTDGGNGSVVSGMGCEGGHGCLGKERRDETGRFKENAECE